MRCDEIKKIVHDQNSDGKYVRLIVNLYWEKTAAVRFGNDWKTIKRGVRQVCHLFSLYSLKILRNIKRISGIKIRKRIINNIGFAGDTVFIAKPKKDLHGLLYVGVYSRRRETTKLELQENNCCGLYQKCR